MKTPRKLKKMFLKSDALWEVQYPHLSMKSKVSKCISPSGIQVLCCEYSIQVKKYM